MLYFNQTYSDLQIIPMTLVTLPETEQQITIPVYKF